LSMRALRWVQPRIIGFKRGASSYGEFICRQNFSFFSNYNSAYMKWSCWNLPSDINTKAPIVKLSETALF
jgi:hypothetical protein